MHEAKLELDLSFLRPNFEIIQKNIKERGFLGTKDLKEYADGGLKNTLSRLEAQIEKQLKQNPEFAKKHSLKEIKAFAQEILRREHIQYLSSLYPEEGIHKEFEIDNKKYSSSQIPIGEFRNCYHRWGVGKDASLSAFRVHTLKKGDETLIQYHHHSSPVVYEEPDYQKSIEATDANLRQAVRETGGGPLTEIRLLSTNRGPGGDYKQAVATYLSAIRVSTPEEPITVFFHGVNIARYFSFTKLLGFEIPGYAGGIETFINTRSTNQLFEKTFKQLGIDGPDLTEIKNQRELLDNKIKNIDLSKGEKAVDKELCNLLKKHHKNEKDLLNKYEGIMKTAITPPLNNKQQLIHADMLTLMELRENKRYLKPKYNGQLQATLVRLNTQLGEHVATGCNDAKDRDGMVSIAVEANEIYRDKHGHYPKITAEGKKGSEIRQEVRNIQDQVCAKSTPTKVAEFVSWPELAKGLDNSDQPGSGFAHLKNDYLMAGHFKKAYHDYYKDHSNNVKNIVLPVYINKTPEPDAKNKWGNIESDSNQDLHAISTDNKNRGPGELKEIVTLKDNNSKTEFKTIKPSEADPDAKAPHRIEIYEREIRYQPEKMPTDDALLRKIVEKVVIAAISNLKPTPEKAEDLRFSGNKKMQQLAKEIVTEKLAKPSLNQTQNQSQKISSKSSQSFTL